MTKFITFALVLGVLFLGLESSADIGDQHPHGETSIHQVESGDHATNIEGQSGTASHCQHCCHGHCFSTLGNLAIMNFDVNLHKSSFYELFVHNFANVPPTPPPIA